MVAPSDFGECIPRFYRYLAVGFRRQGQNHFSGIDRAVDQWTPFMRAIQLAVVKLTQQLDLSIGIPGDALTTVANTFQQRSNGGETLVGLGVVTLDLNQRRHGFAGDQRALAFFPIQHFRLGQFPRRIVLHGQGDQIGLFAQVSHAYFGERLSNTLVNIPVATRFPGWVGGRGQRVDERVHVRGVEVVFFVPGGRGQHDIRVEAGGGHTEIQGHQ